MAKYKLLEDGRVVDNDTNSVIPNDPDNSDWQLYQEWLAEPNVPDPYQTLQELKDAKKIEINEWRNEDLATLQVTYNTVTYDADPTSRSNLDGTITAINAGVSVPDPLTWRDSSNTNQSLSHTDLIALSGEMFTAVNTAYNHSWDLKTDVDNAVDESAVNAIVW